MTIARRRTALHEAGHAVALCVFGLPVEYVSVRPGEAFHGVTVPVARDIPDVGKMYPGAPMPLQPPRARDHCERQAIVCLAGPIAARLLSDTPAPAEYGEDECERIALAALAALPPRLSELLAFHEAADDSAGDEEAAHLWAGFLTEADGVPFLVEAFRVSARELVGRFAPAILAVAAALERQAVVSGDDIVAIVKAS